jgi:choline monooxygenase
MDARIALNIAERALQIVKTDQPELAASFLKVPLDYYRSDQYFQRETEIFLSTPLAVAHSSVVATAFDFSVQTAFGKSLLITRNQKGVARVFLNSCRHRGAEPARGCGNQRRFTCPYHAWTYDIDGKLLSMPQKGRFDGLDFASMGLVELPSEERHGFIWAVLSPGSKMNVALHLGELDHELGSWRYDQYKYVDEPADVLLESNWKATGEGFLEGLHVPIVHRGTFDRYTDVGAAADLGGYDAIGPHVRVFYANAPKLMGELKKGSNSKVLVRDFANIVYWIYPNLILANTPTSRGGTIHITLYPGHALVDSTKLRVGFLSGAPLDDPAEMEFQKSQSDIAKSSVVNEDGPILSSCGRGLRSGFGYALIGRNEQGVQLMIRSLAKSVGCPLSDC